MAGDSEHSAAVVGDLTVTSNWLYFCARMAFSDEDRSRAACTLGKHPETELYHGLGEEELCKSEIAFKKKRYFSKTYCR